MTTRKETKGFQLKYTPVEGGYLVKEKVWLFLGIFPPENVRHDYTILHTDGWLEIEPPQFWNGADVVIDRNTNRRGSLGHDVSINLVQFKKIPATLSNKVKIDTSYFRWCIEDGMSGLVALINLAAIFANKWHRKFKTGLKALRQKAAFW